VLDPSPASPLFPFPSTLFREFPSSSIDAFKVRRPFPALVSHVYWLSFAPSNYRFCHCLCSLRLKLSPINEGSFSQDPLLCLFTLSVCAKHSPSPRQLSRCLLSTRTDSILAASLRVSDSSIQSLSLSPLFTDGFCFLFPSLLGSPNTLSLIAFPLLPLYRFHLVHFMHRLLYAPFAFRIHFDLVYPKHEQLGSSLVSTTSFCQNRTLS